MTCTVYMHTHVDITAIDYVIDRSCVVEHSRDWYRVFTVLLVI